MGLKKRNGMQDCAVRLVLIFLLGVLITAIVLAGIAYDKAQKSSNVIRYCNLVTMKNASNTEDSGVNMFVKMEVTSEQLSYELKTSGDRTLVSMLVKGPYGLAGSSGSNSTYVTIIKAGSTELKEGVSLTGTMNYEVLAGGAIVRPEQFRLKLSELLRYTVLYSLELKDSLGGYSSNVIVNAC